MMISYFIQTSPLQICSVNISKLCIFWILFHISSNFLMLNLDPGSIPSRGSGSFGRGEVYDKVRQY